jgi:hypothetical protein
MKKSITYIILFVVLFCMQGMAQKPGDTKVLADNKTHSGKRELRRETRVKRHEERNLKKQEHKANKAAAKRIHKKTLGKRVKKRKNKEKAVPVRSN